MKIFKNKIPLHFCDLERGTPFYIEGVLLMKTDKIGDYNAVSVETGKLMSCSTNMDVKLAHVHVEDDYEEGD